MRILIAIPSFFDRAGKAAAGFDEEARHGAVHGAAAVHVPLFGTKGA